jgi:hypothetical protein
MWEARRPVTGRALHFFTLRGHTRVPSQLKLYAVVTGMRKQTNISGEGKRCNISTVWLGNVLFLMDRLFPFSWRGIGFVQDWGNTCMQRIRFEQYGVWTRGKILPLGSPLYAYFTVDMRWNWPWSVQMLPKCRLEQCNSWRAPYVCHVMTSLQR